MIPPGRLISFSRNTQLPREAHTNFTCVKSFIQSGASSNLGMARYTTLSEGVNFLTLGFLFCLRFARQSVAKLRFQFHAPIKKGAFQITTTDECQATFSKVDVILTTGTHASQNLRKKFQHDISYGSGFMLN